MLHEILSDIIQMTLNPQPGVSRWTRLKGALAMLAMGAILGAVSWWMIHGAFFAAEAASDAGTRRTRHTMWEMSTWLGIGGICGALLGVVLVVVGIVMFCRLFGPDPEPEKLADVRYDR